MVLKRSEVEVELRSDGKIVRRPVRAGREVCVNFPIEAFCGTLSIDTFPENFLAITKCYPE
jgi:hypothetical protein